jgi:glycosyltransferase involved in cell wall biosynthesis
LENNILVSVLITTYNCENFISKTIDSLLSQTYSNVEIIIIEDGSSDRTIEILKNYADKSNKIKVYYPGRIGRAKALNFGLSECNGKYVAINDADDYSLPTRIELQVNWMENNPEYGLLGTAKWVQDSLGNKWKEKVISKNKDIREFLMKGQPIQHSSVMFRRTVLLEVNGYNENISFLLDRDIFIRIAKVSKLHQLSEPLIILNRSNNQYFKNKYIGLDRINLQVKMQFMAINVLGFNPINYWPVVIKYCWSIILHYMYKFLRK